MWQLERSSTEGHVNPGSIGHPELCPRPCLFYPAGTCVNGTECNFCHFAHPRRAAHLDKRHRAMLRDMPFSDCLATVLPILKERVQSLSFGPEVVRQLEVLAADVASGECVGDDGASVKSGGTSRATQENAWLKTALRAMSVRSLLMMLRRATAAPTSGGENPLIDDVLSSGYLLFETARFQF